MAGITDEILQHASADAAAVVGAMRQLFGGEPEKSDQFMFLGDQFDVAAADAIGKTYPRPLKLSPESAMVIVDARMICRRFSAEALGNRLGEVVTISSGVPFNDGRDFGGLGAVPALPFDVAISDGGGRFNFHEGSFLTDGVDAQLMFSSLGGLPALLSRPRLLQEGHELTAKFTLKMLTPIASVAAFVNPGAYAAGTVAAIRVQWGFAGYRVPTVRMG